MESFRQFITWIRHHLDTPDKRIGSASLIVSIIGVILTVLSLQNSSTSALVVVTYGLALLIVYLAYRIGRQDSILSQNTNQVSELRTILFNQFKNSHDLVQQCKDEFFRQYYSPSTRHRLTANEHRLVRHICRHVVDSARESLQQYFQSKGVNIGEDVAISVKLIFETAEVIEKLGHIEDWRKQQIRTKDKWVLTVFRDHYTWTHNRSKREILGSAYDIADNTAFDEIFSGRENHYLCNDLRRLGDKYHNRSKNWREQYNATLVLPIGNRNIETPNSNVCYGFLAADSLNKNNVSDLYNDGECFNILGHAADLLAIFLLSLAIDAGNLPEVINVVTPGTVTK